MTVTSFTLPFQSFRRRDGLRCAGGAASGTAELDGQRRLRADRASTDRSCEQLGLCNPQTDVIRVLGAANTTERTDLARSSGGRDGDVRGERGQRLTATVTGSIGQAERAPRRRCSPSTPPRDCPSRLQYGTGTTRTTDADGTLATVSVPVGMTTLPAHMRVYLMVDTVVGAHGMLP